MNNKPIETQQHEKSDKNIIVRVRYAVIENQLELGSPVVDLQRIYGYLNVVDFCKLMTAAENKVNPRNARNNPVVRQILETLEKSPELFRIMSRGLLISTASSLDCASLYPSQQHRLHPRLHHRSLCTNQ